MLVGIGLSPMVRLGAVSVSGAVVRPAALAMVRSARFSTTPVPRTSEPNPTKFFRAANSPYEKSWALGRPLSPFVTVYFPHLLMSWSFAHKMTGLWSGMVLYAGAITYAVAPFESAAAVALFHSLPYPIVWLGKLGIVFPLVYHMLNGIRHLTWDMALGMNLKTLYATGYAVTAGTLAAIGYCFYMY